MPTLTCLGKRGFDVDFINECRIGLGVDGSSTMLGKKAGLAAKSKAKFPQVDKLALFQP